MTFEFGDRVRIKTNEEELKSELFQKLNGALGEITEVYSNDYQPDVKRYEVTLDEPVYVNNERFKVIPGLYADNLSSPEKPKVSENRAITKFAVFESSLDKSSWYFGLADCHGIESFIKEPEDAEEWGDFEELIDMGIISTIKAQDLPGKRAYNQKVGMLRLRANANIQRWPVVYRVKLKQVDANLIDRMLNKGLYDQALVYLKDSAEEVQVARGIGTDAKKAWEKIPNPELDPMH